jgi:cytidylate kinase
MEEAVPGVVTISASYGAGGSVIGPLVAERLGLPFLDRAVPAAAARELDIPEAVAEALDERAPSVFERMASALMHAATPIGPEAVEAVVAEHPERFRQATESVLHRAAETTGAVVLGRCGMVVLAGHPQVLKVRLDGPVDARIARVCAAEGLDEAAARRAQRHADRAREAYARIFYHVHQDDPHLYHLVLDTTAIGIEASAQLIVEAAKVRFETSG